MRRCGRSSEVCSQLAQPSQNPRRVLGATYLAPHHHNHLCGACDFDMDRLTLPINFKEIARGRAYRLLACPASSAGIKVRRVGVSGVKPSWDGVVTMMRRFMSDARLLTCYYNTTKSLFRTSNTSERSAIEWKTPRSAPIAILRHHSRAALHPPDMQPPCRTDHPLQPNTA